MTTTAQPTRRGSTGTKPPAYARLPIVLAIGLPLLLLLAALAGALS